MKLNGNDRESSIWHQSHLAVKMLVFLSNVGGNFKSFDHGIITHTHMCLCYLMDVIECGYSMRNNDL